MSVNIKTEADAALQAYLDNADYGEADASSAAVAKAKSFITACRKLLALRPRSTGSREAHTELAPETIQTQLQMALQYVAANDTGINRPGGPSVTRADFTDFRS